MYKWSLIHPKRHRYYTRTFPEGDYIVYDIEQGVMTFHFQNPIDVGSYQIDPVDVARCVRWILSARYRTLQISVIN